MAQHIARLQRWNVTIVKVKVGSTNCGASDAQNAITRIKNRGVVDPFDTNLSFSLPTKRFHKFLLKFWLITRHALWLHLCGWAFVIKNSLRGASQATRSDWLSNRGGNLACFHQLLNLPQAFAYQLLRIQSRQ
jgi:hypothetical protein